MCSLQPAGRDHCVLRSWKIWLMCAVCFLKPEGCTHCVLLRAPRRLLTTTRKRSSLSGLNTQGFGGGSSWNIRVACAVCSLQPAGRDHCVLLRAPRRLFTLPRKRSSLSGLYTWGFGGVGGGALMENMGGVCGVLPKTWRVHPLRSVVRARQTIDHHRETIFTKWAQPPRVRGLMENPGGVRVGVGCFGKYGGGYALCFLKSLPQFTPYLLS